MFSKDLERSIHRSYQLAREAKHEYMTVEHLLLALLDDPAAQEVLRACHADSDRLRRELEQGINESVSVLPGDDDRVGLGGLDVVDDVGVVQVVGGQSGHSRHLFSKSLSRSWSWMGSRKVGSRQRKGQSGPTTASRSARFS